MAGSLTMLPLQAREMDLSPPRLHLKHESHPPKGQDKTFSQKPRSFGRLRLVIVHITVLYLFWD